MATTSASDHSSSSDHKIAILTKECWNEDSGQRPDFYGIKLAFSQANPGRRYNIMDNMLKMMEQYATNLESLIADRTKQLTEEKKKTDTLLYRMLPPAVADSLKSGYTVAPEQYKDVSVYFSDIVSFTKMCSESSPMEVVDFLNDLWTLFDDVIEKYNVYKVETIGDAYMVASGIPDPNPQGHAVEIADMALEIVSSVLTFRIRHKPQDQLRVRIGIHSGPVVTGVVGQKMPRYCLFGDTVNTASRMESNGEPLKIHISEQTYRCLLNSGKGYIINERGQIEMKGKGLQTTYWLCGKEGYSRPLPKS